MTKITLDYIVRKIKDIIGKDQPLIVEIYNYQICFTMYDSDIVLSYESEDDYICIDPECLEVKLDLETVKELNEVMQLLEDNKELLRSFLN